MQLEAFRKICLHEVDRKLILELQKYIIIK